MHKRYPISDQNGQNLYPILDLNGQNLYFGPKWLENHTVWQSTNLSTAVAVYKDFWSRDFCLKKQHNGRDQDLDHQPLDL